MTSTADRPEYFGRYQVLEELGSGAMGVVYLCVDERLARPVAVKVLKDPGALPPADLEQYRQRFKHEAEAAGRLSHPDVVQIYDVGPSYLVMEFVDGRTLAAIIQQGPALTVSEVVTIVSRVADALDYAHRQGIVHRDVKPGNILRLDDGGVKVMDFGVARLPSSTLTAYGTVVGSVRYMAPEQMMGYPVDGRADVFSLGAVAYELLTGRAPFPGKTVTEVVARVVHGAHIPPTQAEGRLPAACDAVFERVFAADPERRYQRAGDFVRALDEVLRPVQNLVLARSARPLKWDLADGALAPTQWTPSAAPSDPVASPEPEASASVPYATGARAPEAGLQATSLVPALAGALLLVDSQPQGARVSLAGRSLGSTPLAALELPYGRHQLHLTQAGHEPLTLEVDLGPGKALQHLSATLQPLERGTTEAGRVVPFRPGMVPPRRLQGGLPEWPADALGPAPSGIVEVEIVVGENGEIVALEVLHSGGERLDAAMLQALTHWRFQPASRAGQPVATRLRVRHQFGG